MAKTAGKKQQPQSQPRPPAKVRQMRRATDIEDVKFPMRAVVGLVLFTAALVGSQWALTSSLRTDIAAIVTRMDAQDTIDKRDKEAAGIEKAADQKVLDGRLDSFDKRLDDIDRQYKLGDYDLKAMIEKGLKR